jgi:hypothetical protein
MPCGNSAPTGVIESVTSATITAGVQREEPAHDDRDDRAKDRRRALKNRSALDDLLLCRSLMRGIPA